MRNTYYVLSLHDLRRCKCCHMSYFLLMCQPGDVAIGTNLAGNQEHMGSFTNKTEKSYPLPPHCFSAHLSSALSTPHAEVSIIAVTMHVNRAFC